MTLPDSIVVENVTKHFKLRYQRTFKQMTIAALRGEDTTNDFTAIKNVSFTAKQGEAIGLMGLNGSGKSTLLKLISGVMYPNEGRVLTRGRIAGLIATGAGFHPQLTGRENIYLNAAVYGLNERETNKILDDVVEFADLGRFLDSPVKNYSSGMSSRLAFSIAVHIDCDIFMADEVLAVGDKPFKRKCLAKMEEIRESGRTIFFVSHAAGAVKRMCDRVLVLEEGRLTFDGDVDAGIKYLRYGDEDSDDPDNPDDLQALEADDSALGAEI